MTELEKAKIVSGLRTADCVISDLRLELEDEDKKLFEDDFYTISALINALEVRIANAK